MATLYRKKSLSQTDKLHKAILRIETNRYVFRISEASEHFLIDYKPIGNGGTFKPLTVKATFELAKAHLSTLIGEVIV